MPAVASVARGHISAASMRSPISKSRVSTSRTKASVSYPSTTGVCPLAKVVIANHRVENDGYLEFGSGRHAGDCELGPVTTEIRGAASDQGRIGEIVICLQGR